MAIVRTNGTPHQRFRKFHTDNEYKDGQQLGMKFCKSVRAGNRVFLRGQTGTTLDGEFAAPGDPGAQADQAMQNIQVLLEEAGASLKDIVKVSTYIQHRDHRKAGVHQNPIPCVPAEFPRERRGAKTACTGPPICQHEGQGLGSAIHICSFECVHPQ